MKNPRYIRTLVPMGKYSISVYAGKRIADALRDVSSTLDLYKGVKLCQILEAVYAQGKKDGARSVFDEMDSLKGRISHRNPGKPRKR